MPPSVREICTATGLRSTSTVHSHLKSLESLGYITRDAGLNRSIHIVGAASAKQVPILGKVTAGLPILAVEDIEGYIPYPDKSGKELFALHVDGLSMINAGILDGDYVVAERTPVAENGEIVVGMIGDEATVKRFYRENGTLRLQPENPDFDPIISDEIGKDVYGNTLAEKLARVRRNDKVRAVVLRVNSPGGSALASDVIWREMERISF